MVTKNTKFETTLARYLISDAYNQLIGYDACIEKQGKTIKYRLIVLGLESLYMTDNPPKFIQLERPFIYYRDIVKAEMIDDYPDFLSGTEKENAIHMRLKVMMPKKKRKKKDPSVEEMETIPCLFDKPMLDNITDYMDESLNYLNPSRDLYNGPLTKLLAAIPLLLSSSIQDDNPTNDQSAQLTSRSIEPLNLSDLVPPLSLSDEFREQLQRLDITDRSRVQTLFDSRVTTITPRSKSARSSKKTKSTSSTSPKFNRYSLKTVYGNSTLLTPRIQKTMLSDTSVGDEIFLTPHTSRSILSTTTLLSNTSHNPTIYCPTIEEVKSLDNDAKEMRDIDIYFLANDSKIPEILSSALNNYIVNATLTFDRNQQKIPLQSYNSQDIIIMKTKFSQLKQEIMQSTIDIDRLLTLTIELHDAIEKYPKVKELFWKDQDLFIYYTAHLQTCIENIENKIHYSLEDDEEELQIKLGLSVMTLLNQAFLNTFALQDRFLRLEHNRYVY
ncbi:unnamed protein product [Didymodactylos carnosus]|nr:unnamed protein product [Didymodactylos carnosus]CAF3770721.1 unnamed protein product [Didymodactylos carnosus]